MKTDDFFASLKKGSIQSCYLFEGEEEYSKESALQQLRTAVLTPPMGMMNETVLEDPDAQTLIAVAETLPLMADKRLVVVRESAWLAGGKKDDAKADRKGETDADKVAAYLGNLPGTTCLVFYVRGKSNGTRKLHKTISKLGGLVSFEPLTHAGLVKWIARELKYYGKQIAQRTAEQLIFTSGRELTGLKGEINKVAAYAGEENVVEPAHIEAICTPTVEYKVFDLADAVAQGNSAKAITLMNTLLREGESRLMLLSLLQRHYRQLFFAYLLSDGGATGGSIAQELGVPPFVADKLQTTARRFSADTLKWAYDYCVDAEFRIKSGQISEEGSLEQVVFALLAAGKQADV